MSYREALEAAGAKIEAFQEYGSYSGIWVARLSDGTYIKADYGSCSGCDAFEDEFDWTADEKPDYQERLASFGQSYLNLAQTKEELIKELTSNNYTGDDEAQILKDLNSGAL